MDKVWLKSGQDWYKTVARPPNISDEKWEKQWRKGWEAHKRHIAENKLLNNYSYKSISEAFEKLESNLFDLKIFNVYKEYPFDFGDVISSLKSCFSLNIVLLSDDGFYKRWQWDEEYYKKGKQLLAKNYVPYILSYVNIAFSALLEYNAYFELDLNFKGNDYKVVFISVDHDPGMEFKKIESKNSSDVEFVGFALLAFKEDAHEWKLTKDLGGFKGFDRILGSHLKMYAFNTLHIVKKSKAKDYVIKAKFPEGLIEIILNIEHVPE